MDKHSDNRISIMINGKEKNIDLNNPEEAIEEQAAALENGDEHSESDIPWGSEDNKEGSNVIDLKKKLKKTGNISFKSNKFRKKGNLRKPPGSRTSLFSGAWVAFISAIAVGVFFGIVVLSLFTDLSLQTVQNEPSSSATVAETTVENPETGQAQPITQGLNLSELEVYVIQGGAFSSVETAETIAGKLEENGFPTLILDQNNPVLLFMGIGPEKTIVQDIGDTYSSQGQEIYVKPYTVNGKSIQSIDKETAAFIQEGRSLFEKMVVASAQLLSSQTVSEGDWTSIKNQYEQWQNKKPEQLGQSAQRFSSELTSSYNLFNSYETSQKEVTLWQGQQALLNSLTAYEDWVNEQQ